VTEETPGDQNPDAPKSKKVPAFKPGFTSDAQLMGSVDGPQMHQASNESKQ
jgi:hypothetical protein